MNRTICETDPCDSDARILYHKEAQQFCKEVVWGYVPSKSDDATSLYELEKKYACIVN